jgi:hypothetical protein
LISEPAIEIEPARNLERELCTERLDDEPNDPVKTSLRPLTREATKLSEPDRYLTIEICSTRFEDDPIDPVKPLISPLI